MKVFDPALLAKAPGGLQVDRLQGQGVSRLEVRRPGRSRTIAPAAACASTSARPRTRRRSSTRRSTWSRSCTHLDRERAELGLLPHDSRRRPHEGQGRHDQGLAAPAAAVRVLRGLRRLRRNALRQAAHAVLRRPDVDRQRHGLLVDLRRQPALHAVHGQPRGPRAVVVELAVRGLRRVRHGLPPGGRSADRVRHDAARAALRRSWATSWSPRCSNNKQETEEEIAAQRALVAELNKRLAGDRHARREESAGLVRLPDPQEHLELRRRRLGLRHRLRRPGPRLRLRPRREHPGARHRGLLEHRRPGVEIDLPRRGGQVRRRRQAAAARRTWA